jgi:hypothetical protein
MLAGVAIVELSLRVFSLAPSLGISTASEAEFRRVPGLFGPGQRVVDRRIPILPFAVRIDSLGYRGADFPLEKRAGELRVLAIGDSYTYGDFVDDAETFPAELERRLSQRCSRPVTVINAGVGGSTITTHSRMAQRAWVTSPDIVMLTFSENDVVDLRNDMWKELAENRSAKSRFPLSIGYPLLRRMALWHFALDLRGRWRARAIAPDTITRPPNSERASDIDSLRAEYRRLLHELSADVSAQGRPFMIVAFPSHWTVGGQRDDAQLKWMERIAAEVGVPVANLLQPFRDTGLPVDSLYLLPHDGHASPRGNELAAAWVATQMIERDLCRAEPEHVQ